MARHPEDLYGDEGSVPRQIPLSGSGGHPMSVRANPEDFGAQIGQGEQKIGEAAQGLANEYGGMINETLLTKADAALAQKIGQIKGEYLQNTGLSAAAAFPKYQADLEAARQEARANLPLGAQRGFDMVSMRTVANHMADGSTYAAGQIKADRIDSGTALANSHVQAVLDPDVAKNPERVQWHQDSAIYGLQMSLDEKHPGLKTDPETGTVNFDESKLEGQNLKAQYQAGVDNIITQTQTNRFNALAKGDVLGAFGIYQQERDSLPKPARVQLDSMFKPRVFNAHVDNGSSFVMANANQDYARDLYNPRSDGANHAIDWTMTHEGGYVANDSGKGPTKYGINQESNPDVDVNNLTQTQAAKIMHDKYYIGVGADKMPTSMSMVALDTAVNMGVGKAKDLVAKSDGDPQKLIDLRREEYQRLSTENPAKYGQYLDGWNSRLDDLQRDIAQPSPANQPKSYATNPDGSKLTNADYYRTHSEDVIQRADAQSERDMPGDLQYKRAMRETVTNYMNKVISNQSAQYTMDNKNIVRAINGEFTKGKTPETETELRAIPGVDDLLNRVSAQDPKFAEGIPTMIAKMARRNDVTNSHNGYDTILRTLQSNDSDHPNKITHQSELDSLLGKSDGTGINMKDYNDAKSSLDADSDVKEAILTHMKEITNANGNIDGKGQERSLQWYNQTMAAYKKNEALGDKKDPNFAENIGKPEGPLYTPPKPSRIIQMENWLKEKTGMGQILVTNPDGQQGYIPAANAEKAIKAGYKKVE